MTREGVALSLGSEWVLYTPGICAWRVDIALHLGSRYQHSVMEGDGGA